MVQRVLWRKGINSDKSAVMSLIKTPAKTGVICSFHESLMAGLGFLYVSGLPMTLGWLFPASGYMSWLTGDVAASSTCVMTGLGSAPLLCNPCFCDITTEKCFHSKGVVLTQFAANSMFSI